MLIQIEAAQRKALHGEGWERRFTADPQRVKEAVELYSQLGYEVRTGAASEFGNDCDACHAAASQFQTIYTR